MCQQECPCVERVQDSALLPVNVERKVTLVGKHLNVFQVTSGHGGDSAVIQPGFFFLRSPGHFCVSLWTNTHRTTPWTTSACWTSRASRWWWRRPWSRTLRARPTSLPVNRTRSESVSVSLRNEAGHHFLFIHQSYHFNMLSDWMTEADVKVCGFAV